MRTRPICTRWDSTAASRIELTHLNQAVLAKRQLGEYEQFSFAGWNNDNVFGYVVKPANFKRGQKYPVAFLIHGGPAGKHGQCLALALERAKLSPAPATAW